MMPKYDARDFTYINSTRKTALEDMYTDFKVIKVKEGWREFYYCDCDGQLIEAEDNGFDRASCLPDSEAQEIAKRLRKERPSAEISLLNCHKMS